jgi:O-antigen ligase
LKLSPLAAADAILPGYLALCLVLGGASAAGIVANTLLQLLAVAIIALYVARSGVRVPGWRSLTVCAGLAVLIVAVQLAPLPAGLVSGFPGRREIADGYRLLGLAPSWGRISLDGDATIASALALLPPFAVAAAALHASKMARDAAVLALLAMIVVEIALGALQVTSGGGYYFYEITNAGLAVGFFANANHMATLLLVGLPYVAAMGTKTRSPEHRRKREQPAWLALALGLVLLLGVLLNGSVAGLGLLLPAVAASYLLYRRGRGQRIGSWTIIALVVVVLLLLAFLLLGPLHGQLLDRKLSLSDPTTRRTSWAVTALAAREYFPIGTGLGSFVPVYQLHEQLAQVTNVYVNHAHNDYLELLLELGVAAVLLLILFVAWYVRRAVVVWRSDEAGYSFARAGSVAVAIILLHSLVDYPIRTAAIAAVFALSLALMAAPEPVMRASTRPGSRSAGRHFTAEEAAP